MRTRDYPLDIKRYTGAADIASTFTTDKPFVIHEIRLSVAGALAAAETFTATLDSASGAAYDHVIASQDMTSVQKHRITGPWHFGANDEIDFALTNSLTRVWGIEVFYEESK